jgi:cell division protein FtsN
VSPTRDRFEAERRRASLAAQGYDTAVVRMQRDGDTWYRVRVGRYPDKSRADSARQELRDRFGVDHAFVLEE